MKKNFLLLILSVLLLTAGCAKETAAPAPTVPAAETIQTSPIVLPPEETENPLDAYIASLQEQSDLLRASLEQDPLTQAEMNAISQELYELWDGALNHLWSELKTSLPEADFADLLIEQRAWITAKEEAVEAAGKEFEGGSLHALIVNTEAASITEARVYQLCELLK